MKFSIITPTFNSAAYLESTLKNIQAQTYPHFEHIVVDGASTDHTVDLLRQNPQVRWISEKDRGQSEAINKGFRLAAGDILAWQNADDLYFPNTFEIVANYFQQNPTVDVVYGYYQLIDSAGERISDVYPIAWNLWLFAHGRFVPMQPTTFWRRRVYETIGELNENLHYCMDVDFFARAAQQFTFARIPAMLGKFRIHPESKTYKSINQRQVYQEYKHVLSRHFHYNMLDRWLFDLFYYRSRLARRVKLRPISANAKSNPVS